MSELAGFLTVNRNVQHADSGGRDYRLPRAPAFPKLDRDVTALAHSNVAPMPGSTGHRLHLRLQDAGPLPEMTTDMVSGAERSGASNYRRPSHGSWSLWLARVLGAR